MAMIPIDDDRERFRVVVWKDEDADEQPVAYAGLSEAQERFARLRDGGSYYFGELLEWVDHHDSWRLLDSWEHKQNQVQEMMR